MVSSIPDDPQPEAKKHHFQSTVPTQHVLRNKREIYEQTQYTGTSNEKLLLKSNIDHNTLKVYRLSTLLNKRI